MHIRTLTAADGSMGMFCLVAKAVCSSASLWTHTMLGITKFCGTALVQKGAVRVTEDIGFFKHSLEI